MLVLMGEMGEAAEAMRRRCNGAAADDDDDDDGVGGCGTWGASD